MSTEIIRKKKSYPHIKNKKTMHLLKIKLAPYIIYKGTNKKKFNEFLTIKFIFSKC